MTVALVSYFQASWCSTRWEMSTHLPASKWQARFEGEGMSGLIAPPQRDSQTWITKTSCAKSTRIHRPSGELDLGHAPVMVELCRSWALKTSGWHSVKMNPSREKTGVKKLSSGNCDLEGDRTEWNQISYNFLKSDITEKGMVLSSVVPTGCKCSAEAASKHLFSVFSWWLVLSLSFFLGDITQEQTCHHHMNVCYGIVMWNIKSTLCQSWGFKYQDIIRNKK